MSEFREFIDSRQGALHGSGHCGSACQSSSKFNAMKKTAALLFLIEILDDVFCDEALCTEFFSKTLDANLYSFSEEGERKFFEYRENPPEAGSALKALMKG